MGGVVRGVGRARYLVEAVLDLSEAVGHSGGMARGLRGGGVSCV